ncbi:MAG: UDP-2,3-diacylglucosamine diphosphatase [Gammaproteobacteria bacterium]|uniref:UDP-2,3-diacylglucosamine diphosphatase n=1 Tax=uncultured Pseudoalteromonas sp. TaxID=114053 RepID=UPI002591B949|nr:UDP-2,3-diacylglucosamine diphosphatase [uncultured Pseudoalteromonas sp.]MCH2481633.1 UDP-2,3-diacylglucosamine diphosphatase [Gammaproteobacteria bacterium]
MSIAFISDLHLTPDESALGPRFKHYLSDLASLGIQNLFILGDLFEYWLGDDASEHLGQSDYETILKDFSDIGMAISVLHGNRDFLLGSEFSERTGCVLISEPFLLVTQTCQAVLLHGDSLCTDDIEHQTFRNMVRAPDWQRNFLRKPIMERDKLAQTVRYRSEYGKSIKPLDIMDVNQSAVVDEFNKTNARVMIHGHTHRPGIHRIELNDSDTAYRIVLGDWANGPSAAVLNDNVISLSYGDCREELVLTQ